MSEGKHPRFLVLVRFKSALSPDEFEKRYKERLPEFRAIPGLMQKYYLHGPGENEWGGLYLWDSRESLDEYQRSELRKSIAAVYQVEGPLQIDVIPVIDALRS